ncbi:MAG: MinD/ParA family protein [Ruminococcaceae bacterium]|nr:MinD/ParA family protein [Oscillospiraceae bacterium]
MKNIFEKDVIYVVCGHYGVGKTNIAVNMALNIPKGDITLIDLDIVNPFFRSADNKSELEERGVRVITPLFANTNVDVPSIPPDINSVFYPGKSAVFDVGGDDAGAIALCGFAEGFKKRGYEMYYVINMCRPQIEDPQDAAMMMREIENTSGMKFCAIINNTNLGAETDKNIVLDGMEYARKVSKLTGLEIAATTVIDSLESEFSSDQKREMVFIKDITKHLYC